MNALVLAIGNFDGVHKAHKKILQKTKELAKELNLENNWGVMYFTPHPRIYLKGHTNFLLTNQSQKFDLLKELRVPHIIEISFAEVYNLTAEHFFLDVLIKKYNIKGIVTGSNFNFGKDKVGNKNTLLDLSLKHNIKYVFVEEERYNIDVAYSSSNIRKCISEGNIKLANDLLDQNFKIQSKVIHGKKLGRLLGFPTANLSIGDYVSPEFGVYVVYAYVDRKQYRAIANFGLRPTATNEKTELLEVNLLDFDGDLYDKIIEVEFLDFIRVEKKFNSLDELKEQMNIDKQTAVDYFKKL